jgi:ketosteroid isomerase-like protein
VSAGAQVAVERLSAAFAARDVEAALACFVPDHEIGYAGSGPDESATGRIPVRQLLKEVFAREEAYSWTVTTTTVHLYGETAYVYAEVDGLVRTDDGELTAFPYRISGLLEAIDGAWLWRHCQGCQASAG